MATPRRGEVWLIDFGQAGKTRPALVVSVAFGDQDRALITVVDSERSRACTGSRIPLKRYRCPPSHERRHTLIDTLRAICVIRACAKPVDEVVSQFRTILASRAAEIGARDLLPARREPSLCRFGKDLGRLRLPPSRAFLFCVLVPPTVRQSTLARTA